jgi:hypothetical protein
MATMRPIRFQQSSALSRSGVFETLRRVESQALDLLSQRIEIDLRIRSLHKVVNGLRHMATNAGFDVCHAATHTRATERTKKDNRTLRRGRAMERMHPLPGWSRQMRAGLVRACRIALMEAEGTASLDEIRRRILRRGSFSFEDSTSADAAIIRAMEAMAHSGEVRRLEEGSQSRWERIATMRASDPTSGS